MQNAPHVADKFTPRLILIVACIIAGWWICIAYSVGRLGLVATLVAYLLFGLVALVNVRWGLVSVFAFSLFQPLLTRVLFSIDFPDALKESMLDYNDPLTTAVSLLLVGAAFLALAGHLGRSARLASAYLPAVIALYAFLNFLQIFNPNKSVIAGVYGAKNNVLPILMLFAGSLVVRTPGDTVRFVKFVAWFSVVALAYGLYQEIIGLPAFEKFYYSRTSPPGGSMFLLFVGDLAVGDPYLATSIGVRVPSVFYGYTFYSYIIAAFGIIVYAVGGKFTERNWRLLRLAVLLLLAMYFVVSTERIAIIMFGVGILGVHFTMSRGKKHFLRFVFLGSVSLLIVYAGFLALVHRGVFAGSPRLIRIAELADPLNAVTMTSGRIQGPWVEAVSRIQAHPFIGTGAGSGMYTRGAQQQDKPLGTHNELLHKQMELGVFGLFLFLVLLFLLYKALMREGTAEEEPPCRRALAAGMVGVLAAYVLCGLVNVPLLYEPGIVFWFLAGAALGTARDREPYSGTTEMRAAPAD